MNKIYTLLILTLFLGMSSSFAQTTSLRSIKKAATKAMEEKDFYSAWQHYEVITGEKNIKKDSIKLIKQMYNLGDAARQFKAYDVAKDAYEMVMASKNRSDYPLVEFWLARVYHSQGKYEEAILHYSNYAKEAGQTPKGGTVNEKQEYAGVAESAIENCTWAKVQREFKGFKVDSLKSVNTHQTEFAPLEHNSSMYYSALEFDELNSCPDPNSEVTRMYTSDYSGTDGITSPINWAKEEKGKFVAHTAFNTNGERMYFTICNRVNAVEFECEIYYRDKSSGLWGDAIRLPEEVNLTGTTSTQPNIGYDENLGKELLFFVSNRADSLGGANNDMNIYCSIIEADGRVSAPSKIDVNTSEDDVTPFFNKATKILYFSSKGYQGFGGYDIYQAEQMGSSFADPIPLEKPINSSYDDYYFSADEKLETIYFSTNRLGVTYKKEGLETCCDDIYKLEIIKVNLEVTTFNTLTGDEGLDSCRLTLTDITDPENPIALDTLDPSGHEFKFKLELEKDYRLVSKRGGKDRWTYNGDENRNTPVEFTTKGITESQTIKKQLYHTPVIKWNVYTFVRTDECSPGSMVSLPKCTFDFTNKLTGESSSELEDDNHFKTILESGKEYEIVGMPENPFFEAYLGSSNSAYRSTKGYTTPTILNDTLYFKFSKNFAVEVLLYYHNDYPKRVEGTNGRKWAKNEKITNDKYDILYNKYIAKKERLIYKKENRNMAGLGNSDIVIDTFFNGYVIENFEKIGLYISVLENLADVFKDSECQIQLDITGYTSPRASEAYNERLGHRRTYCFIEYVKEKASSRLRDALPADVEDESKLFNFDFKSEGERPDPGDTVIDGVERLGGEILNISDEGTISIYGIGSSKRRKVKVGKITVQPKSSSSQSIR
jgi:hypothetical protein